METENEIRSSKEGPSQSNENKSKQEEKDQVHSPLCKNQGKTVDAATCWRIGRLN